MFRKYFYYFKSLALTRTAKSTYLTTFGAGLNALLGFIFTVVVARSISPSDFGLFSVVMNFIMILFVTCDIGLSSSVLRFLPQALRDSKKDEAQKIIKLSFLATALISGLLTIILFAFSGTLSNLIFLKKELALPIAIASFSLIGLTLSFLFTSILQAQQRFLFGVITDSSILFIKVLVTLGLLLLGKLTLISVLIVFSLTTFTGFLIGLFFIGPKFVFAKTDFSLAKVLFLFGLWVALARVANAISSRLDTIMLIRYVDPDQVGFYAAAQRMTFVFQVLVNGMTVVISPKFSALKTKREALAFFKKASLLISILFLPIIILFFLAPWVTVWIYGNAYAASIYIFRWLLVSSFFFIASSIPTVAILYFLGQSRFFAILSAGQLVIIFLANLILIPRFGVIGPAISLALAYAVVFLASLLMFLRKAKNE